MNNIQYTVNMFQHHGDIVIYIICNILFIPLVLKNSFEDDIYSFLEEVYISNNSF